MKTRHLLAIGAVLLGLLATRPARAEDPREMEGRALFAKGEYERALDVYARLFAEKGDPLYLRNIGRCYQKLKRPEKAIDSFREYLRRARVKAREREEVEGFIHEMEELQTRQAAETPPPPVTPPEPAAVTGPPPAPPPAALTGGATTPPGAALTGGPGGGAGQEPAEEPTPLTHRWWFWAGIGAVVVGGVVAALVLSSGGGTAMIPACDPNTTTCPR